MTKYFVDATGKYLGGWDTDPKDFPANAIEVPAPPADARQHWNGASYDPAPPIVNDRTDAVAKAQALAVSGSAADIRAFAAAMAKVI